MSEKITGYLFIVFLFAGLATLVANVGVSVFVSFLVFFAIGAVGVLTMVAFGTADTSVPPSERDAPLLPVGFGRALLEKLPTALILINDKGRITYSNSAANALVPFIKPGNHFANMFRAPVFIELVNEVLADGEGREATFSIPGQDRIFHAQIQALPQGSDFGEAPHVIVQIEERTKERLAERMRTDFVANASHELRTPLASIIGYIETLQGHAKDDPQARERFLGIMASQATRMNRLIADLMSLSRIEMNAHVQPEDICDIHAIFLEVGAALQPVAEKADVLVEMRLVPGMRMVQGDHDQIAQVATNLIDNAIKYGGGAPVRVSEAKPNEKYPRMVGITVEDQGAGISRNDLHRLTERFYRTSVAKSRSTGGTGLGLAIVKHIANRHHGELQIESNEGAGSRFTFWVPEVKESVANGANDLAEYDKNIEKTNS